LPIGIIGALQSGRIAACEHHVAAIGARIVEAKKGQMAKWRFYFQSRQI
jgi:hypothetical protein